MRVSDGSGNRSGIPGKYGADIVEYDFSNHHSDLLWNYLYGNGDAGAMTGYSYTEIIVYTLLAGLVSKLVITGFEYQINEDIKDGGLNKYLIRPVNYCGYRFCSYLGGKDAAADFIADLYVCTGCIFKHISRTEAVFGSNRAVFGGAGSGSDPEFLYLLLRGVVELLADGRASAVRNSQRGAGCCQRRRVPPWIFSEKRRRF